MKFSTLSEKFTGQGMFQILSRAKKLEREGKSLIHFEIGDPDFNTPEHIKQSAVQSILTNETHYTESAGLYELRQAACAVTLKSRKFLPDIEQTLVTSGANMQLYIALSTICNPGDEVIIPNPYFPSYKACTITLGLNAVELFDINYLTRSITSKTKVIIINSPNNPTGNVLTKDEINSIYDIAHKNDLWIISDEVYSRQIYEGEFYSPSMIDKCRERVIVVNGFSKSFSMTGWRLGVITAPKELISKLIILLETIVSCVPPFIQRAGITALTEDQIEVQKMTSIYKNRMELMVEGINQIKGLSCDKPKGALYCWVNIQKTAMSPEYFSDLLLQKGVVVCPGRVFGDSHNHIRLSFCTSEDNIIEGLQRMSKWNK